jgi:hypothetical protein
LSTVISPCWRWNPGASSNPGFTDVFPTGFQIIDTQNVIVRNVKISKVLAEAGDALAVQAAHQVWIDHVDLSSDRGKPLQHKNATNISLTLLTDHDKVRKFRFLNNILNSNHEMFA